jgi:hypothetical protein
MLSLYKVLSQTYHDFDDEKLIVVFHIRITYYTHYRINSKYIPDDAALNSASNRK